MYCSEHFKSYDTCGGERFNRIATAREVMGRLENISAIETFAKAHYANIYLKLFVIVE